MGEDICLSHEDSLFLQLSKGMIIDMEKNDYKDSYLYKFNRKKYILNFIWAFLLLSVTVVCYQYMGNILDDAEKDALSGFLGVLGTATGIIAVFRIVKGLKFKDGMKLASTGAVAPISQQQNVKPASRPELDTIEELKSKAFKGDSAAMVKLAKKLESSSPHWAAYWYNKAAEAGSLKGRRGVEEMRFNPKVRTTPPPPPIYNQNDKIQSKVFEIIEDKLSCSKGEIHLYSRVKEDLGADSLDAVELIMEMEKEFDITIPDDVAEKIRTVGDIVSYIRRTV